MATPFVVSGMEKPHDLVCGRINTREVRAFHQIALGTSQGEVVIIVGAIVLPRSNMFDMKAQFGEFLWNPAVLATTLSAAADEFARCRVHQAAFGRCKKACASVFRMLR